MKEDVLLVVDAGSELLFFRSAADATAYMEPIDVRNGEYLAAFDMSGNAFKIEVRDEERSSLLGRMTVERVHLIPDPESGNPEDFRQRLSTFLNRMGVQEASMAQSIGELFEMGYNAFPAR